MGKHVWPTYLHHKSVSKCYVSPLGKGKIVTGMSSREMQQQKKHRQESRMNTNQFLKWALKAQASKEVWSRANRMLDFNFPKSFPGFLSHSERILARFQLGSFIFIKFLLKYIYLLKIWLNFIKWWEPVWIPTCCLGTKSQFQCIWGTLFLLIVSPNAQMQRTVAVACLWLGPLLIP